MQNANLLSSRVRNYSRLLQRRVVLNISVDKQTPVELLRQVPGKIRELIESHQPIRFDRSHFALIGPASFDFEAVYFVLTNDYAMHMDILQDINLRLVQWLAENGIMLATPQRVYYVDQQPQVHPALVERGAGTDGGSAPAKN